MEKDLSSGRDFEAPSLRVMMSPRSRRGSSLVEVDDSFR